MLKVIILGLLILLMSHIGHPPVNFYDYDGIAIVRVE